MPFYESNLAPLFPFLRALLEFEFLFWKHQEECMDCPSGGRKEKDVAQHNTKRKGHSTFDHDINAAFLEDACFCVYSYY